MIKERIKRDRRKPIDKAIDGVYEDIATNIELSGAEYPGMDKSIGNLERLIKIKKDSSRKISDSVKEVIKEALPATITGVCGLLSVLMIVKYEQNGIITTKSFPFVPKGRA